MPIRMDFKIIDYNIIKNNIESNDKKFHFKGILDIEELHYTIFESYKKTTSYNVLLELSKKLGLGFATNITNTDDNMTWINPSNTYLEFINNITEHAYINDNTFVWSFIDFYYNLNFVDIEKELGEKPKDVQSTNLNFITDKDEDENDLIDLYLSNSDNLSMTNKYISKFNLNNQSTKINLKEKYQYSSRWFNKSENTIEQFVTKENNTNDTNLVQLITDDSISISSIEETFLGKIDEDNVHKNYHLAKTLNKFNISKLHKVTMTITLQFVNFEIKRFQKILIELFDTNILKDNVGLKEKLSGYWFVTGINYNFKRQNGATQEINLVRRDLNLTYKDYHDIRKILNKKK